MREIKFRAWHASNKGFVFFTIRDIWINGVYCSWGVGFRPKIIDGYLTEWTEEEIQEKTKGTFFVECEKEQFTGLKDKNGRDVYEGDILGGSILLIVQWCPKNNGFQLTDGGECYCYRCQGDVEMSDYEQDDIEVIGNIHENPELLK